MAVSETFLAHHALVNGIDIYYEDYHSQASAPVFILLHGFLSSSFSFRKLIPLLSKDFRVISVDLPPFGRSGKSKKYRYTYENMAKTVLGLLDYLSIDQIYAAGHSMGGQIVMNMMLQRPNCIKKAILLCSSSYLPKAKTPIILSSYLPFFNRYVKYYLGKTGVLGNLENVVFDKALINDDMVNGYMEPFHEDHIFSALTRMLRQREGDLPKTSLQMITTHCLLIWGDQDRVVPLHIGERLANDLPHSELVVLNGAGHLVPEEMPMQVYSEIKSFIND
ncbi:alpha/beta fold hydrolase [Lederbergia lenta]|uniref:alpha/beta fold hydrolase n=1 Tax=Lederbergia lenta TaxID=1467 RepID=UPI0008260D30